MAWIEYRDTGAVPDTDNILRVHGVSSGVQRAHYDLYIETMRKPGPLSRVQRERIAVAISDENGCHY